MVWCFKCLVAGGTGQAGVIIFSAEFFRLQFHKRDKGRPPSQLLQRHVVMRTLSFTRL